jgi:hypothetical protein
MTNPVSLYGVLKFMQVARRQDGKNRNPGRAFLELTSIRFFIYRIENENE